VVSKNTSTLNTTTPNMLAIATELAATNASIFLAQKTNTAWNRTTLQAIDMQYKQIFHHKKLPHPQAQKKQ